LGEVGVAMGGIQDWESGMGADSQASRRGEDLESKRKKKEKSWVLEPIATTTGDSLVFFLDFS